MAADKQYLKCSAKEKEFRTGGSVIRLGVKVEDLIAFAKQHGNERGYLNLSIIKRRSVGQYGDTHSVSLDDYEPQGRGQSARPSNFDEDAPF